MLRVPKPITVIKLITCHPKATSWPPFQPSCSRLLRSQPRASNPEIEFRVSPSPISTLQAEPSHQCFRKRPEQDKRVTAARFRSHRSVLPAWLALPRKVSMDNFPADQYHAIAPKCLSDPSEGRRRYSPTTCGSKGIIGQWSYRVLLPLSSSA